MILHIASKQDWSSAQAKGEYAAPSLATEGFIHFSTDKQAIHVANAFYKGRKDLVLLVVDESKLAAELKWEAPAGPPAENISQSDLFPHLYGPLNLNAVTSALDLQPDPATGAFTLPNP
ncbi:MAG: hypothetical protein KPEEDBHJ_00681 [Anaerolineales bacterium]|nr:hypothetical protein [Anaerolineales bacterium]